MKDKIVLTENMAGFAALVSALINKPERMDRIGLVFGKWGLGKTTSLEWFYSNNFCFYARAMSAWSRSVNMMVEDLLHCYRVEPVGRLKKDIRELVRAAKKHKAPLFIDEANRIVRKSMLIETIRDIHDLARVPIVLIGQEDIMNLLKRRDLMPVFSRITEIFEFKELTASDIQRVSKDLCDLGCSEKVASFIRTVCLGDFRLVNALLIKAEDICSYNKLSEITQQVSRSAAYSIPDVDESDIIASAEKASATSVEAAA